MHLHKSHIDSPVIYTSFPFCAPAALNEDISVDGRIILNWVFKIWNGEAWTGLIWRRIDTGGGRL